MNTQIVAILISEGSKIVGQLLRNRPITIKTDQKTPQFEQSATISLLKEPGNTAEKASTIASGCVPCAIGHLGTCSGLLNEAIRFAKSEGMMSDEVIERTGMCLDELNAMERVDLRPEMVVGLADWEKELVDQVLVASRQSRHAIENLGSVEALEQAAATAQSTRTAIWKEWIKRKVKHLTPEEQKLVQQRIVEKLDKIEERES